MCGGRGSARIARTRTSLTTLRDSIDDWIESHATDTAFKRFSAHLSILRTALVRMCTKVEAALKPLDSAEDVTWVYERCRQLEESILIVRRTFEWYTAKYDQRKGDGDRSAALLAADEIVRSCWSEPFANLHRKPPSGPLAFLDARFDAMATTRVSVPSDLRAPSDAVVAEVVQELPIPTVALPASSPLEPWWLVLAAHETGHHVQRDLGLEHATRDALTTAAVSVPGGSDLIVNWAGWGLEAFADAYSVLMVGPAAAWAVDELQYGPAGDLVTVPKPGDRYPPVVVRLALLGELARALDLPEPGPGREELDEWVASLPAGTVPPDAKEVVRRHLTVTPEAAKTLVTLPVLATTLRQVCGPPPEAATLAAWAYQMYQAMPALAPQKVRRDARIAIAAGVRAYQQALQQPQPQSLDRLASNLVAVLRVCGDDGTLAAGPPPAGLDELADTLADRVLAAGCEQPGTP